MSAENQVRCPRCQRMVGMDHFLCGFSQRGGLATGESKSRGNSEYYSNLGKIAAVARAKQKRDREREDRKTQRLAKSGIVPVVTT